MDCGQLACGQLCFLAYAFLEKVLNQLYSIDTFFFHSGCSNFTSVQDLENFDLDFLISNLKLDIIGLMAST